MTCGVAACKKFDTQGSRPRRPEVAGATSPSHGIRVACMLAVLTRKWVRSQARGRRGRGLETPRGRILPSRAPIVAGATTGKILKILGRYNLPPLTKFCPKIYAATNVLEGKGSF